MYPALATTREYLVFAMSIECTLYFFSKLIITPIYQKEPGGGEFGSCLCTMAGARFPVEVNFGWAVINLVFGSQAL